MAMKALMLRKKIDLKKKEQEALRAHGEELEKREAELTKAIDEVETEEEQVRAIPGLTASQIGFISVSGFENAETKYACITGEDLYSV